MNDELERLRPEVRCALGDLSYIAQANHTGQQQVDTIRAELLRLPLVEAELAESRETIKRLNRRVQVAEAGISEKVKASAQGSLGRALANAAASKAEAELAALMAKIAESAHVDVTLGCAIDGEIPPDLALCKVALVKVDG